MDKNKLNNNEANDSGVEIKVLLGDIWRGVIKFGWIALALAVLFAGVQFYRSYVRYTPVYKVTATFTVHTENKVLSGEDGVKAYSFYYDRESADRLTTVFPHIIGNKLLQQQVCEDLGVDSMPASVSATGVQGTNMMTLTATGSDPQLTYDALLSVIENYSSVADYIIGRTKLVMINEPVIPEKPSNTTAWVSSVMSAALIGLVLGMGWILIYAILRKTIRTKEDIRNVLNQHCVGILPQVVFKKYRREINKNIILTNQLVGTEFLESLRLLRGSIQSLLSDGKKSVMITSTAPSEGKTVVSVNLASIFARDEKKVLLIDADLRDSGIQEVIEAEKPEKERVEENEYFYIELIRPLGFYLLTFKEEVDSIQKIIRNDFLKEKLNEFSEKYDLIFVDTPPCGVISDASIIARVVETVIYVIRQDAVLQASIRAGINSMLETDAKFLGCILNGTVGGFGGYGSYYKYAGYYRYYNYSAKYGYSSRYGYSSKYGYSRRSRISRNQSAVTDDSQKNTVVSEDTKVTKTNNKKENAPKTASSKNKTNLEKKQTQNKKSNSNNKNKQKQSKSNNNNKKSSKGKKDDKEVR